MHIVKSDELRYNTSRWDRAACLIEARRTEFETKQLATTVRNLLLSGLIAQMDIFSGTSKSSLLSTNSRRKMVEASRLHKKTKALEEVAEG